MGQLLHVFCLSDEPLPCGEVLDFLEEGVFFINELRFDSPSRLNRVKTTWCVDVYYETNRRPIQICFGSVNKQTLEVIDEMLDGQTSSRVSLMFQPLFSRLKDTRQELRIEVGFGLPDECWEMLDNLEAFVARKLDGIVYDYGKLYDANLQPLWTFTNPAQNNHENS